MASNIKFTQEDILRRGVIEVIEEKSLKKKLNSGRKLRVKLGIDPTGPELHLGHAVNLWKLRQFQELGHKAVLIIGDYTASIGDPSGKDKTRLPLNKKQIKTNYKTYEAQVQKILLKKNLEIRWQSEWFNKFKLKDIIKLTSYISVGYLLSHETFSNRLKNNKPFSTHELLYPFLQGYDSVAVKADIELGAQEQKFNLLMGRVIQKAFNMEPQDIIMSPYLTGTDGKEKMGKTTDNYIALQSSAEEMFGRVMSINDEQIVEYFELATPIPSNELVNIKKEHYSGKRARDLKLKLAAQITTIYWGEDKTEKAVQNFSTRFQKQEIPSDIPRVSINSVDITLVDLLIVSHLAVSKSESRRLVISGAVRINGDKQDDANKRFKLDKEFTLSVGKRKMVKIYPKK